MKKRAIPQVPKPEQSRQAFDIAVKENMEVITGRRGDKVALLASTASLDEVIAKINELVNLLQE